MTSRMAIRRCGMVAGLIVSLIGCSSSPPTAAMKSRANEQEALKRLDRQHEIEALIDEAVTAPEAGERTAAALLVAEHATGKIADAMRAIDSARDVVLNNIVNAQSTAFKASHAIFADGKIAGVRLDLSQGGSQYTGRPLDVMIQGQGFFKIKIASTIGSGFGYTRSGNLFINYNGDLMLGQGDGYKLQPSITLPTGATDISIGTDGVVGVLQAGSTAQKRIGRLEIIQFVNPEGLNFLGGGVYCENDMSGPPVACKAGESGAGQVLQMFLEASNVDLFRERLTMRFLQDWKISILQAVEGVEAKKASATVR
jgi:flagellar basal body rod protein FlgG